jgi:hypothetical protein
MKSLILALWLSIASVSAPVMLAQPVAAGGGGSDGHGFDG